MSRWVLQAKIISFVFFEGLILWNITCLLVFAERLPIITLANGKYVISSMGGVVLFSYSTFKTSVTLAVDKRLKKSKTDCRLFASICSVIVREPCFSWTLYFGIRILPLKKILSPLQAPHLTTIHPRLTIITSPNRNNTYILPSNTSNAMTSKRQSLKHVKRTKIKKNRSYAIII